MSGLEIAKKNLEVKECKSLFEKISCEISLPAVEKIIAEKFQQSHGIFAAWQIQNVVFGTVENGKLKLKNTLPEVENFLECRIFNEVEELHLKNISAELRGRYVRDEDGEGNFFVDSFSRFWGECKNFENNFAKLIDSDRKLCLEIPAEKSAKYFGLLTRNYIGSDEETGLSGYVDYRFVKIEGADIG